MLSVGRRSLLHSEPSEESPAYGDPLASSVSPKKKSNHLKPANASPSADIGRVGRPQSYEAEDYLSKRESLCRQDLPVEAQLSESRSGAVAVAVCLSS
jgi:hypothetical protein